jgi:hypothetical protein
MWSGVSVVPSHKPRKPPELSVKRAYLSIGSSIGLDEVVSTGEVITSRADSEITSIDIEKAQQDSEDRIIDHIPNRKIIHAIPLRYRVSMVNLSSANPKACAEPSSKSTPSLSLPSNNTLNDLDWSR